MAVNKMQSADFEKLFNICRIALRMSGILAIDSIFHESEGQKKDLKLFYYIFGIGPVIFVFICEIRGVLYFWRLDINIALEILAATLSGFVVIAQGFCLYYSRKALLQLIFEVRKLWSKQLRISDQSGIIKRVRRAHFFTQIYAVLVILLAGCFTLRPFCLLFAHLIFPKNETYDLSQTAYPTIYPFVIDTLAKYIVCIICEFLIFISVGAWWIAADMIFLQLTTHLCVQYQVLGNDLRRLQENSMGTLNTIGIRHTHLLSLSKRLEHLFKPIVFILMLITSVNMCAGILSLQKELSSKSIGGTVKCLVHTVVTMVQPAIYCKCADDLFNESQRISIAVYQCDWVSGSQKFKKCIRLVAMNAQNTLEFRTYGFYMINVNQITQIGATAVRFFALIRTVS